MGELPSDSVKSEVCFGYSKEGQDRERGGLGERGQGGTCVCSAGHQGLQNYFVVMSWASQAPRDYPQHVRVP